MGSMYVAIAAAVAFGVTAGLGIKMIPFLHRLKFGQTIREVGPAWHKKKQGTPTMGGLMFILGTVLAVMLAVPLQMYTMGGEQLLSVVRVFSGLLMAFAFGVVGFMDDFISIRKKRNLGLTEGQKLVMQFLIAGAYLFSLYLAGDTTETLIPFVGLVDLGIIYYILAILIIVAMVNAVNFADGIDGLNGTVTFVVSLGFMVVCFIMQQVGLSIYAGAIAGGCLGFLLWNLNPAKVFMGDTGSLYLGGAVSAMAFGLNMPILLLPMGIIYIAEIASVVLQVSYFKLTKGKRLFKMAPIHHHFEMCGWGEMRICAVFGIVAAVGCALGIACVAWGL